MSKVRHFVDGVRERLREGLCALPHSVIEDMRTSASDAPEEFASFVRRERAERMGMSPLERLSSPRVLPDDVVSALAELCRENVDDIVFICGVELDARL